MIWNDPYSCCREGIAMSRAFLGTSAFVSQHLVHAIGPHSARRKRSPCRALHIVQTSRPLGYWPQTNPAICNRAITHLASQKTDAGWLASSEHVVCTKRPLMGPPTPCAHDNLKSQQMTLPLSGEKHDRRRRTRLDGVCE